MKDIFSFKTVLLSAVILCGMQRPFDAAAQERAPLFRNGDRIAFIGNSITHSGWYHSLIYLYYITRFPESRIQIFNNGISGDVAPSVLRRFDDDILTEHPTVATIKLGMNDVNRDLYSADLSQNVAKKAVARTAYIHNTDELITRLQKIKCRIILIMPSRFDETVVSSAPNRPGVNEALKSYGLILDSIRIARRLDGIVNFNAILDSVTLTRQRSNHSFTLNRADRIHPEYDGHFILAYQFLKAQHAPMLVSNLKVDIITKKVKTVNCAITNFMATRDKVSFDLKENALPFPVNAYSKDTTLVPFTALFNQEVLEIDHLSAKKNYRLLIDGITVGSYSGAAFGHSINIANNPLTPQQQQAAKLTEMNAERKNLLQQARDILFVKYKWLPPGGDDATDEILEAMFSKKLKEATDNTAFLKRMTDNYIKNRRMFTGYKAKADSIVNELYLQNKPLVHHYQIIRE